MSAKNKAKLEQSHVHVLSARICLKMFQNIATLKLEYECELLKTCFHWKDCFKNCLNELFSACFFFLFKKSLRLDKAPLESFNINFSCFFSIYSKHYGANSFSFQEVRFFAFCLLKLPEVSKKKLEVSQLIFFPIVYRKYEIYKNRFRLRFAFPFIWRDIFLRIQ